MQLVPKTMDFRLKLFGQKVASFLPYNIYRFLVDRHPKLLNPDYDAMINYYIENCGYAKPYGLDVRDTVIVETGTGGSLADPITFYLLGAAKTFTFDIRLHVNLKHVWNIIDHYENNLENLAKAMEVSVEEICERWKILKHIRETENFDKFLRTTHINLFESQTIPKDVVKNTADIFFSNSVLHRISLKWLKRMLNDANRVLKREGVLWHKIDCNDINSMYDKDLSKYHYLRYSDFFWRLITSEIYNNQNRLRQSDFLKLFEEVGFEPLFVRSQRPKDYEEQLRKIKLNKRFQGYDLEDLAVTNFIIYAGRAAFIKVKAKYELYEYSIQKMIGEQ